MIALNHAALFLQAAPAGGAPNALFGNLFLFGGMILIFWLLLIRPQQKRMKAHQLKLGAITRGDTVITNGGLIGKVTKATDEELTVDLGGKNTVKVVRSMIADVRGTTAANDTK